MYEGSSLRLESRFLPSTPHKHLFLWSDHHINSGRWLMLDFIYIPSKTKYLWLSSIFIIRFFCEKVINGYWKQSKRWFVLIVCFEKVTHVITVCILQFKDSTFIKYVSQKKKINYNIRTTKLNKVEKENTKFNPTLIWSQGFC